MPIISVTVENADELLNTGYLGAGALGRVERAATQAGAYSEISTFPLVSGTRLYTVYDLTGATDSWYRVRYTTAAAGSPSSYGDVFQSGDETGGLICSVYDVEQELGQTLSANEREQVIEKIRQVGAAIEGFTGRWFIRRPLSGTTTYRMHTVYGRTLRIPKGITSITTLGYGTTSQGATGGTFTSTTDYWLDPPEMDRDVGWPATAIRLLSPVVFTDASFGAEITGAFGWPSVPYDIQGVAIRAVVRRFIGKSGGGVAVAVGPNGTEFLLPDLSGSDRKTLEWYAVMAVA